MRYAPWIVVALLCASTPALAAEGVIVQRDASEVVIDLGSKDGLSPGTEVAVYRRLEVVHPVTKKKIEDRFPIGKVRVDEVGESLSIVRVWTGLERPPAAGDYVTFSVAPPPPPKRTAPSASATEDPVETAYRETLGRSLTERIAIWEHYLRRNPESPWAKEVSGELQWLRSSLENQRLEPAVPAAPPEEKAETVVTMPAGIVRGRALEVDVAAVSPERVESIRLGIRPRGALTYEMLDLERNGDHNWSATIPAQQWADANQLEYFAETLRKDGQLERASSESTPLVDLRQPEPDPRGPVDRSRATLLAESVNFKAGAGDDEYTRFEGSYRYAVDAWVLSGFSVGVGLFRGRGAALSQIEAGEPSRDSLLGYGFAELDFGLVRYFGINMRMLIGNNQQLGVDGSVFEDAFGFGGELRFGEQFGTQLLVGSSFTETIGAEAWIKLDIDAVERVPMTGEVVVTNLPVGKDLGVSLNFGAGYAFTDWFSLLGRVGWNARTTAHHGPTAGVSTVFNW